MKMYFDTYPLTDGRRVPTFYESFDEGVTISVEVGTTHNNGDQTRSVVVFSFRDGMQPTVTTDTGKTEEAHYVQIELRGEWELDAFMKCLTFAADKLHLLRQINNFYLRTEE